MGLGGMLASSSSAPAAPYLSFIFLGSGSRPAAPTIAAASRSSISSRSSATSTSSSCAGGASRDGTSRGGETDAETSAFVADAGGDCLPAPSDPTLAPRLLSNESEAPRACFPDAGDAAGL